jgi:N-acetylmuramoyl-L-alanine amidase
MATAEAALRRLCDPQAQVSAHYVLLEDGGIQALVAEDKRAWHAGVSAWQGREGLNDSSIGIEIVNPGHGHGYRPFPEPQLGALAPLVRDVMRRWAIPAARVVGHSDVAPDRKLDPGERFPWQRLAAEGVGVWPSAASTETLDPARARRRLSRIGYRIPRGPMGEALALAAFQRHFRPERVDGRLDAATMARLTAVASLLEVDRAAISGAA